jgi:hypothetical protein
MTTWSGRRQLVYGSIFLIIVLAIVGIPAYLYFFDKPETCMDQKQNQNETGVDCGGVCARACMADVLPEPIQLWARAFKVTDGVHNLVAYVQNANVNYVADPAEYVFKMYDKDNVLVGLRVGHSAVPPVKSFPIFEQSFDAGLREIGKVQFEFTEPLVWNRFQSVRPELTVSEPRLKNASTSPRIDAELVNNTLVRYENIEVIAIVYGSGDNAIASSRTIVPVLASQSNVSMVFTWPSAFDEPVTKVDIIPKLPI